MKRLKANSLFFLLLASNLQATDLATGAELNRPTLYWSNDDQQLLIRSDLVGNNLQVVLEGDKLQQEMRYFEVGCQQLWIATGGSLSSAALSGGAIRTLWLPSVDPIAPYGVIKNITLDLQRHRIFWVSGGSHDIPGVGRVLAAEFKADASGQWVIVPDQVVELSRGQPYKGLDYDPGHNRLFVLWQNNLKIIQLGEKTLAKSSERQLQFSPPKSVTTMEGESFSPTRLDFQGAKYDPLENRLYVATIMPEEKGEAISGVFSFVPEQDFMESYQSVAFFSPPPGGGGVFDVALARQGKELTIFWARTLDASNEFYQGRIEYAAISAAGLFHFIASSASKNGRPFNLSIYDPQADARACVP